MLKVTSDTATAGRKITFSLPAEAGQVSVVGNFNDWTPGANALAKRGSVRSTSVVVPTDYIAVFRYLGEDGLWFDEPEASFVDAGASVLLPAPAKVAKKAAAKPAAKAAPAKAAAKAAPAKAPEVATRPAAKVAPAKTAAKVPPVKAPAKVAPVKAAAKAAEKSTPVAAATKPVAKKSPAKKSAA